LGEWKNGSLNIININRVIRSPKRSFVRAKLRFGFLEMFLEMGNNIP
jgi:hypothetical protein